MTCYSDTCNCNNAGTTAGACNTCGNNGCGFFGGLGGFGWIINLLIIIIAIQFLCEIFSCGGGSSCGWGWGGSGNGNCCY